MATTYRATLVGASFWPLLAAAANGLHTSYSIDTVHQERADTSPIWYAPQ